MRNFKVLNWLKWIGMFIVFVTVVSVISTFNAPKLDSLTGEIATRYIEMPSGKYAGDAALGTITGKGSFYFDTGEIYEGSWKDNEMSGNGKFTYTTGVYEGDFSNSKRNGQGTFTWEDGVSYVGAWSNDLMNGAGKYTISSTIYLEGTFDNGKLNGTYTYHNEKGNYKTTWVDNKNTGVKEE